MQLRIFTEPQQGADYGRLLAVARAAEELGFDVRPGEEPEVRELVLRL